MYTVHRKLRNYKGNTKRLHLYFNTFLLNKSSSERVISQHPKLEAL